MLYFIKYLSIILSAAAPLYLFRKAYLHSLVEEEELMTRYLQVLAGYLIGGSAMLAIRLI